MENSHSSKACYTRSVDKKLVALSMETCIETSENHPTKRILKRAPFGLIQDAHARSPPSDQNKVNFLQDIHLLSKFLEVQKYPQYCQKFHDQL